MVITKNQKIQLGLLMDGPPIVRDSVIAFGADMYRQGMIKGAFYTVSGIIVGKAIEYGYKYAKQYYKSKKESES